MGRIMKLPFGFWLIILATGFTFTALYLTALYAGTQPPIVTSAWVFILGTTCLSIASVLALIKRVEWNS